MNITIVIDKYIASAIFMLIRMKYDMTYAMIYDMMSYMMWEKRFIFNGIVNIECL